MRASRAKGVVHYVTPENLPELIHVRGVPMQFIFDFVTSIIRRGYVSQIDHLIKCNVGGILFGININTMDQSRFERLTICANEWSCTLSLLPSFNPSDVSFNLSYKFYQVVDVKMVSKRGWLRDMTIARMMTDEWSE